MFKFTECYGGTNTALHQHHRIYHYHLMIDYLEILMNVGSLGCSLIVYAMSSTFID